MFHIRHGAGFVPTTLSGLSHLPHAHSIHAWLGCLFPRHPRLYVWPRSNWAVLPLCRGRLILRYDAKNFVIERGGRTSTPFVYLFASWHVHSTTSDVLLLCDAFDGIFRLLITRSVLLHIQCRFQSFSSQLGRQSLPSLYMYWALGIKGVHELTSFASMAWWVWSYGQSRCSMLMCLSRQCLPAGAGGLATSAY